MTGRPTSRDFSDRPSRPEQLAHLWHELHQRDATHPPSRVADAGWWGCRACRRLNPFHRSGLIGGLMDIRARIVDSVASANTTQIERKIKDSRDYWRRRSE